MYWILFVNGELITLYNSEDPEYGCVFEASASKLGFNNVDEMIESWQTNNDTVISFEAAEERALEILGNWDEPDFVIPELNQEEETIDKS